MLINSSVLEVLAKKKTILQCHAADYSTLFVLRLKTLGKHIKCSICSKISESHYLDMVVSRHVLVW
jgi:hypothetical protein